MEELEKHSPSVYESFCAYKANQEIEEFLDSQYQSGPYAAQVNTMHLPAGNYYYKIQLGSQTITRSFIIMH